MNIAPQSNPNFSTTNTKDTLIGKDKTQDLNPNLDERQNLLEKGIDTVADFIGSAIYENPLSRISDVTSFVETDRGATGFTSDDKKVSNLSEGELNFLKQRNEEMLKEETGFGQPIISGTQTEDAKFKLYDPLSDYISGEGSTGVYGNRAAQNMLMQQKVAGEPIVDALLRQKRVEAQAPSLESLRAVAMAPSVAEQRAMKAASLRRESEIEMKNRLRELSKIDDPEVRRAAQMAAVAPSQSNQEANILSQLSPTQLTYLLGELGYDITPKATEVRPAEPVEAVEAETKVSDQPISPDLTFAQVPTSVEPSTPISALDFARSFKATFDPSQLSGEDLTAYNFALRNPNDPRSRQILIRLGAL